MKSELDIKDLLYQLGISYETYMSWVKSNSIPPIAESSTAEPPWRVKNVLDTYRYVMYH